MTIATSIIILKPSCSVLILCLSSEPVAKFCPVLQDPQLITSSTMPPATEPPKVPPNLVAGCYALRAIKQLKRIENATKKCFQPDPSNQSLPNPSKRRKLDSLQERPYDSSSPNLQQHLKDPSQPSTIFYLAYGSNLSSETFKGRRGIRPISQTNVVVPELVMTFDLAGLPYLEPCFANTRYRSSEPTPTSASYSSSDPEKVETTPPSQNHSPDYHKTRWHKGLVGVVYEVTPTDYSHIIATEGGGAAYQDILIKCHPLPASTTTVPLQPTTPSFLAHTLFSPLTAPGTRPPQTGGRFSRPDPNYAQPSARYIKLITDGADEHDLPLEYKEYLRQLRPYSPTSQKQRLGAFIFGMLWVPFLLFIFGLNERYSDKRGRAPKWLIVLSGAIFGSMWKSYDGFFRGLFGDGERTVYEHGDEEEGGVGRRDRDGAGVADGKEREGSCAV